MPSQDHNPIPAVACALREAAHRYAEAGWPVFPCQPGGKTPATIHGHLDATTSHARIDRWWARMPSANVAIACGAPGPDVLDIDIRPGLSGFTALRQATRAGLIPPRPPLFAPPAAAHTCTSPAQTSAAAPCRPAPWTSAQPADP